MDVKKKKKGFILSLFSILLIPGIEVLIIVGFNSNYLIKKIILFGLMIFLFGLLIQLILGMKMYYENILSNKRKIKKWLKIVFGFFMTLYMTGCIALMLLMYGPNPNFRNAYINTALKTMHHKYLAYIFYSDEKIEQVKNSNYFIELDEDADTDSIKINTARKVKFKDEYEEELLTRDEGDLYKVIDITVGNSNGYLVAIYEPDKVKVITAKKFNVGGSGERVITMCDRYGGLVCINAGGFVDYGMGSDIPQGYVIKDGKIVWPSDGTGSSRDNIIGLTSDGKLKLMSNATGAEAIDAGIVDGLVFGPFLIVNGKPLNIVGDPWGKAPRVAIAQREDGVMMFLVVDGENYINGASLRDMIEILQRYGAYNAANLDGGQSTSLVINGKLYNNPPAAAKAQNGRYVVTGFGLIP